MRRPLENYNLTKNGVRNRKNRYSFEDYLVVLMEWGEMESGRASPVYRRALNLVGTMRASINDNAARKIDRILCSVRKHLEETRTRSFELCCKSERSVAGIADWFRKDPRTAREEIYAIESAMYMEYIRCP